MKPVAVHSIILLLAIGSASYVWLRDKAPAASVRRDVVVWRGKGADVERVEFTKANKRVLLEGKTDSIGHYFVGMFDAGTPSADDAGAPSSPHGHAAPPARQGSMSFVSVGPANKIADKLGELRALRDLGKIPDDRAAELGLKDPEGRVVVTVRGTAHSLDLGMVAPGGSDRYVRDLQTQSVYVVEAEPLRELEGGEHTLVEKELHEFPMDPDVDKITVSIAGKTRTIVRRGTAQRRFFADPGSPEKNDETATTWMSKVERLKPAEFSTSAPVNVVGDKLRVDYAGTRGALGFLEVVKTDIPGSEPEVWIRTERTRLWAKTTRGVGEQVLGDVTSITR